MTETLRDNSSFVFGRYKSQGKSAQAKEVDRDQLINVLNQANFLDKTIIVNFSHAKYDSPLSLSASLRPCQGDLLECFWEESEAVVESLQSYDYVNIILSDGLMHIIVEAELVKKTEFGIVLRLPAQGYEVVSRKYKRHPCQGVSGRLSQNGMIFDAVLVDFSDSFLTMELESDVAPGFSGVNQSLPIHAMLCRGRETFYSKPCEIIRQEYAAPTITLVLKLPTAGISRFPSKQFRSVRQRLSPSPNLIFYHPLMQQLMNFKVIDLSGSGFSIEEEAGESVLFPGLILPEVELEFVNGFKLPCKAQVLNCIHVDEKTVKSGLAILDIHFQDYIRLAGMLHQAYNSKAYVCSRVDADALWRFFFETGFVYPAKYGFIEKQKESYKKLYQKLYDSGSQLAVNFMCQDKGKILGHMSMLRFYERTWIIHHHAALSSSHKRAGLVVLEQIGRFINEFHRLPSANMDYVACYFRSENKFPNLVFGSAARRCKDMKECSQDTFSYFHFRKGPVESVADKSFILEEIQPQDLAELERYYEYHSGGLMLQALDLIPARMYGKKQIDKEFARGGLKRAQLVYAVKSGGRLQAVIVVNLSDTGLNMSDLTNCFQVFVLETSDFTKDKLYFALSRLVSHYEEYDEIPVLLFPSSYAARHDLQVEKEYNFWVLNTDRYGDQYFQHINKLVRRR